MNRPNGFGMIPPMGMYPNNQQTWMSQGNNGFQQQMMPPWMNPWGQQAAQQQAPRGAGQRGLQMSQQPMPQQAGQAPRQPMPQAASQPAIQAAFQPRKWENPLDPERYKNVNISEPDLMTIVSKYGDNIEGIYELNSGETLYYQKSIVWHQMQLLQFVWHVNLKINRGQFRLAVDELCKKMDSLRVAYAYNDLEHPYKILLEKRSAEINFREGKDLGEEYKDGVTEEAIGKILDRDRVRSFDLENDPLLRVVVYKTPEEDDYIILFSQPHINTDGTSLAIFMKNLLSALGAAPEELSEQVQENRIQDYADYLSEVDKEAEIEYWKKCYDGFGGVKKIPGHIIDAPLEKITTYTQEIPGSVIKGLRSVQGSLKVTTFTILQSVWALLLGKLTASEDITFGSVLSGRDFRHMETMKASGELSTVLPLRVNWDSEETVGEVIQRFQSDYLQACKNSHCAHSEIISALGRKTPVIDHVLNYENLPVAKENQYSPDLGKNCKLLSTEVSINSMADLNLLFFNEKEGMRCEYHYNVMAYSRESIELIAGHYNDYLDLISRMGADMKFSELPEINVEELELAGEAKKWLVYKVAASFNRCLGRTNIKEEALIDIAGSSKVRCYHEGEVIIEQGSKIDFLPLVMKGCAEIYQSRSDGQTSLVAVAGTDGILSFAGFSGQPSKERVVASEDDTWIILIPADLESPSWRNNPKAIRVIFRLLERQYLNYAGLWMNQDYAHVPHRTGDR